MDGVAEARAREKKREREREREREDAGLLVVSVDAQHAVHGQTFCVRGDEDHALSLVAVDAVVGVVVSAHDDVDLASVVAGTRAPPLAAVEHELVAVFADVQRDVAAVGRGLVWLGHEETRTDLAGQQRGQPLLLLLSRAVSRNDLHVARVGGGAVAGFRRGPRPAKQLAHQPVLEVREGAGAVGRVVLGQVRVVVLGQEHVPDA